MNVRLRYALRLFAIVLSLASAAWGQWSSNPNKNLALSNIPGADQVQPKLAVLPDSSWYASWFNANPNDPPPIGYDTYLQRLNAKGFEQFPHDGVQVAKLTVSSTQDYGLDVDSQGNALLTFLDDRENSNQQITAAKMSPSGQPLWGTLGVQLTDDLSSFHADPKIAATSDGQVVVGWTSDNYVVLQRLDANGHPKWPWRSTVYRGLVLGEPGYNYILADMHASDNGSVIISWVRSQGFRGDKYLYTNKISPSGKLLWGAGHVKVWDGGSLQFGNFPYFLTDGKGGAVFAWYSAQPSLQSFVQHVRADGSEAFVHNGVPVSTNANQIRVDPSASYRVATGDIFVFWTEEDSNQFTNGIYAQRIDSTGARKWSDNGLEIVPLNGNAEILPQTVQTGDGVLGFWIDQDVTQNGVIRAIRLNKAGHTTCAQFPIASALSQKGRMWATIAPSGLTAVAFQDYRDGNSGLYIQNVNSDCSLGTKTELIRGLTK